MICHYAAAQWWYLTPGTTIFVGAIVPHLSPVSYAHEHGFIGLKSSRSIESIDRRPSRVKSRGPIQVESVDRVEQFWARIDREPWLDRFRGLIWVQLMNNNIAGKRTLYERWKK